MPITKKLLALLLSSALLGACVQSEKSANALAPTVAGPIPGVGISNPEPLEPTEGARIAVESQPLTLVFSNAASNGVRPLSYTFELAADAGFTNLLFQLDRIEPGANGRTAVRLPDPLAPERTYYWRTKADDGANAGPYSRAATFTVFTPIVIGKPEPRRPSGLLDLKDTTPPFVIGNSPRSGPAGQMNYVIELSDTDTFATKIAVWVVRENGSETTLPSPIIMELNKQYFWRTYGFEATTQGPWSDTQSFRTPEPPPPPPPPPPSSGGGGGGGGSSDGGGRNGTGGHVPPGPLSASRAEAVVFGTFDEFPGLHAVFNSDGEAEGAAEELLLRTIWHLQLAGFQAGRQRNPSGVISKDKLTINIGGWHVYDVYSLGFAGRATTVQFLEVPLPSHVPDGGIPD
jgi:hypothetical protein